MTDVDEGRLLVAYDWLITGVGERLHFAGLPDDTLAMLWEHRHLGRNGSAMSDMSFTLACGRTVDTIHVPGVLTRMSAKRCRRCCDYVGLPHGIGSPKNDVDCRIVLDMPCSAIDREYDGEFPIPTCQLPPRHSGDHQYTTDERSQNGDQSWN